MRNGTTLKTTVISRPVDSRTKASTSEVRPPESTDRISHTSATAAAWNSACHPADGGDRRRPASLTTP